jgi:GntR family transcriptional regulator/MocR family aminotransferase
MELPVTIDRDSGRPLHEQLVQEIRQLILNDALPAGTRLPSIRHLSEELKISRPTIALVYEQLASEGYLTSSERSGVFVVEHDNAHAHNARRLLEKNRDRKLSNYARRVMSLFEELHDDLDAVAGVGLPDLQVCAGEWLQILEKTATNPNLVVRSAPAGARELCQAYCDYVRQSRGLDCKPEQIMITGGTHMALHMVSRLLINEGDLVAIEEPCSPFIPYTLRARGADLVYMKVDSDGANVTSLPDLAGRKLTAIITKPIHQIPLAVSMNLERRRQLLRIAEEHDAFVLEDDCDSDLRYSEDKLPRLFSLNQGERVILSDSVANVLFPSLRIGCLVVPPQLAHVFVAERTCFGKCFPLLQQHVLADFMRSGRFERHIRLLRNISETRRRTTLAAFRHFFGSRVGLEGSAAGLHVLVRFRHDIDTAAVVRIAADNAIPLVSTRPYYKETAPEGEFIFSFGRLAERQIESMVRLLARCAT